MRQRYCLVKRIACLTVAVFLMFNNNTACFVMGETGKEIVMSEEGSGTSEDAEAKQVEFAEDVEQLSETANKEISKSAAEEIEVEEVIETEAQQEENTDDSSILTDPEEEIEIVDTTNIADIETPLSGVDIFPKQTFQQETEVFQVDISAPEGALPAGTVMQVEDVPKKNPETYQVELDENDYVAEINVLNITFYNTNREEIEPLVPVDVHLKRVALNKNIENIQESAKIIHLPEEGLTEPIDCVYEPATEEAKNAKNKNEEITPGTYTFQAESFSEYALIYINTYQSGEISAWNQDCNVEISYKESAKIPEDAVVEIQKIDVDAKNYNSYREKVSDVLGKDIQSFYLLDISIKRGDEEIEPQHAVDVEITCTNPEMVSGYGDVNVLHFDETKLLPEMLDVKAINKDGVVKKISFETGGFSVYAVADVTVPEEPERIVQTIAELANNGFLLSVKRPDSSKTFYFMDTIVEGDKIKKTAANKIEDAKVWYFEPTGNADNEFYMYFLNGNDERTYMNMTANGLVSLSSSTKTPVIVDYYDEGVTGSFFIHNANGYGFNMRRGDNGVGFNGSNVRYDVGSRIVVTRPESTQDDPYELDGKTYGIMLYQGSDTGVALMSDSVSNNTKLKGETIVARPDPTGHYGNVYVLEDNDMSMWTFQNISHKNYYITTVVDGITKYLSISASGVKLVDAPDETTVLTIQGNSDEQLRIAGSSNHALRVANGNAANGFSANTSTDAYTWMLLTTTTYLEDDDFVNYVADKVSVSDTEKVYNGCKVVVYTRVWNETEKKYDFYVVNHNGTLLKCYDSGDEIRWTGSKINTILWEFTEYYYEGTNNPNYYYDLQSEYSGKYLAPQIENSQVISDNKIGINMNGRRWGDYYTQILAWDDANYDYASLEVSGERLVVAPMAHANDFYFAILDDVEDELTTVETVDNDDYGIRMKMIDYVYPGSNSTGKYRQIDQTNVLGLDTNTAGLLETNLDPATGYPMTNPDKTGKPLTSLGTLFENAQDVNHLFLQETYAESGYFEYNCMQNFASLQEDGNFKVYDQIATIDGTSQSLKHGQFFPYNDISEGLFSTTQENLTDVFAKELPELDPRKGERLYRIPFSERNVSDPNNANHFFGMEIEADFMQTESGQDNWNHDLIFEFAGDDDMWLYLDGELVLDLGGVHSALTGSINFKTGVVTRRGETTNLKAIFKSNYETRNPMATEAEVNAYLDEIFEENEDGQFIFKDYTTHTMKVFYMERGANASNLHMRFNLSNVEQGEVILNKAITGTDKQDYSSAKFAYQIYYKSGDEFIRVNESNCRVVYKGTNSPVDYRASYNGYDNVFLVHPNDTIDIFLPEEETEYYIVECDVNTNIYDYVKANSVDLNGDQISGTKADFATEIKKVKDRKKVIYENHVDEDALRTLTITKRLFDENGDALTAEQDPTGFRFRLFMGEDLDYYRFDKYCVKAPDGTYCTYDKDSGGFVSTGIDTFSDLSDAQKTACQFTTSLSGAVDKIKAGYSVEIRNILVGTKFKVEERTSDIPNGYEWLSYERISGSYIINPGSSDVNEGIVRDNSDPQVEVHNRRGWGLTVKKEWSDDDYMDYHDNIYFGVYANGVLIPSTVRRMRTTVDVDNPLPERSLYYYFHDLLPGADFKDYEVKELLVENPVVDTDGYVTSYTDIQPLDAGDLLTIGAKKKHETYESGGFSYDVDYVTGDETGVGDNIREDIVKNVRSGIKITKTDWNGNVISGGTFTLKDENGTDIGAETYAANKNGLITIAYMEPDVPYYLREVTAPAGHIRLEDELEIMVQSNGTVVVNGDNTDDFTVTQATVNSMPEIRIKNKTYAFNVRKTDADTNAPMEDVAFAVYRQRTTANGVRKDYMPVEGLSEIRTNANGYLPSFVTTLSPGTYYLVETETLDGYSLIDEDVIFTINENGEISLDSAGSDVLFEATDNIPGVVDYKLTVKNSSSVNIAVQKTVQGNMGNKDKAFRFKLQQFLKQNGTILTGAYAYSIYDTLDNDSVVEAGTVDIVNVDNISRAHFLKNGTNTAKEIIDLSHGERLVIEELQRGVSFSVEEVAPDATYTTDVSVSNLESETEYYAENTTTAAAVASGVSFSRDANNARKLSVVHIPSGGVLVNYTNTRQIAIPTTAIHDSVKWLLFAIVILGVCLGISKTKIKLPLIGTSAGKPRPTQVVRGSHHISEASHH